ncbi:glycosyltransferase family 2 protein [Burkholderia anthina]|uniref:Glycosyltransferase family 2 protein n=1 Tax=Burkholderia anthina TaxID=179879 RepID=A0A7T6VG65_9BURK|nr:glycosyltransferase family 2 protein [Burkholderia anthina]QQK03277.1 glycosyltransferase family 2 protein [Burkholderia anthina]
MKIGIAAIFKNECESIVEWVAYHRAVGIDYFLIADNESTDGSSELLGKLARAGFIDVINFKSSPEERPQLPAYTHMLKACPADVNLLAFIDADEFILPMDGADSIHPLCEDVFSDPEVSALALNWATFGSSGHIFVKTGLVIDKFTKMAEKDFGVNHHYKSIVRPERVDFFENPHHARLNGGRYVDSAGSDVVYHERHGHGLSRDVIWKGARINHYAVKSLEEFIVGKSRKGSASRASRVKHADYFYRHDKNDVISEIPDYLYVRILRQIEEVQAGVESVASVANDEKSVVLKKIMKIFGC